MNNLNIKYKEKLIKGSKDVFLDWIILIVVMAAALE